MGLQDAPLDLHDTNTAISSLGRRSKWKEALQLFQDLHRRDLRPSAVSYGACINSLGRAKQWERSLLLLHELLQSSLAFGVIECCAALKACSTASQCLAGLEILEIMSQQHVELDVVACNTALTLCDAQWQRALKILHQTQERDIATLVTYSAAISCCEKARKAAVAVDLFEELCMAGHEPNTITFSATVSACEKVRLLHWHHEVLYSSGLVDEQKPNSQICVDEQKFYI